MGISSRSKVLDGRWCRRGLRRWALGTVVLCIALPLTGCVGASSSRAPSLSNTKDRYVARINAICRHYNDLQGQLEQPSGSIEAQAATAHRVNLLTFRKIADARRVQAPPGDQRVTESLLDDFERAVRLADSSTRLVLRDPEKATLAARKAVLLMDRVALRLNSYGLKTCAQ